MQVYSKRLTEMPDASKRGKVDRDGMWGGGVLTDKQGQFQLNNVT